MKNIVILISGAGSNMQAIVNANIPNVKIAAVISNRAEAEGLKFASKKGIVTELISHKDYSSRLDFDQALMSVIDKYNPCLVVLAGFMRILSTQFCEHYHLKLMNVHPSLLPAFKGENAQEQAIKKGVKLAGATIHFVTADLDNGPIIAQGATTVTYDETVDTLKEKILKIEHEIYPQAIDNFVNGYLKIENGRAISLRAEKVDRGQLISC